ncbi:MAG TPA: hypothetical protein VEM40_02975 [Nitrospirota bacterium]|nr:hypothetical protein [Nitrospirota bacterium]
MQEKGGNEMEHARKYGPEKPAVRRWTVRSIIGRGLLYCLFLLIAAVALGAYEHFKLRGESTQSLVSLLLAAGFGFAPIRALVRELFVIEGKLLHLVHGVGGLVLGALVLGGVVSGGPLLTRAALAPFAIMGAAQAVMHQDHPRNPQQAEALRRFATSLPEVEQFTKSGNLTSPENVRRAVAVLNDLVKKAQVLGETELQSDPGFQGALRRVTTRYGLSLGLDVIDRAIADLSANPAAASAVPELRNRLAKARKALGDE